VFVARETIRSVDLRRGPGGERIVVQLLFALVLIVIAFASVRIALGEWDGGGTLHARVIAGAAFGPFGAWVVWRALRPVHYLYVRTSNDARKLLFAPRTDPQIILSLVARAARVHGYEVTLAERAGTAPYRDV
jgi:hypothetical protein